MITLDCQQCGHPFEAYPYQARAGRKWCSTACANKAKQRQVVLTCERCGETFEVRQCRAKTARYCSEECVRSGRNIACKTCGTEFYAPTSEIEAGRRFCSKRCARLDQGRLPLKMCGICGDLFQPRERRNRFCSAGCRQTNNARVSAEVRGDKQRDRGEGRSYRKRNGRHEHRVVAEQMLGRPLRPGEVVHHVNENKRDNRPENLKVFPSQAEHARHHALINKERAAQ